MFRISALLLATAIAPLVARAAHATCTPTTPNGVLNTSEQCDDGNSANNDGCSSTCVIESGWSCDRPVSFTGIVAESYTGSNANWTVTANGQSGTQTVNTDHGTFGFVGAQAFAATYTFTLKVNDTSDDDFIGFALGLSPGETTAGANTNYLLLDWKSGDQTTGTTFGAKGVALSQVTNTPTFENLWGHSAPVTQLQRSPNWGSTGWVSGTTYTFVIAYTASTLHVTINGTDAFNVTAASFGSRFPSGFPDGQVAFYGLSQPNVTYTVTGPFGASKCNRPPTVTNKTVVVAAGTTPIVVPVTAGYSDPDGTAVNPGSARAVTQPTNGTAVGAVGGTSGAITITPTTPAPGSQLLTLTYELCDSHPTVPLCGSATVTAITGPTAVNDTVGLVQGTPTAISVASLLSNDNNVDSSRFTSSFPATTLHGTLALAAGTLTYTPVASYFGSDSFSYTLCNTTDVTVCKSATVTLDINGRPTLTSADTCVAAGTASVGLAVAPRYSDPDAGPLTRVAANAATGGTLAVNGTALTFTPTNIATGAAFALSYLACDNGSPEACGTGSWSVTYNDAPVVVDAARVVARGGSTTLAASDYRTSFGAIQTGFATTTVSSDNDIFGATAFIGGGLCTVDAAGTVTLTGGPLATTTSCFVRVCETCDAAGASPVCSTAEIVLTVRECLGDGDCASGEVCDPTSDTCVGCLDAGAGTDPGCDAEHPACEAASGDCYACNVDLDCTGGLLCDAHACVPCRNSEPGSGIDTGCSIAFPVCAPGDGGPTCVAACGDGVVAPGEACDDGDLDDGDGCSASCQIEADYQCTSSGPSLCNRAPAIDDVTTVIAFGDPLVVDALLGFTDPDGDLADPASVQVLDAPDDVVVTVDAATGMLTLAPVDPGGAQSFALTIEACDLSPLPRCDTRIITVVIGPSASDDALALAQGDDLVVLVDDLTDNDGDVSESLFTFDLGDAPAHGVLDYDSAAGTLTYTPDASFAGVDTATYELCSTVDATVCVTANVTFDVNGRPTVSDAASCVPLGTPSVALDVAPLFSDPAGDGLGLVTAAPFPGGSFEQVDSTLTFTPGDVASAGIYSLALTACDDDDTPACDAAAWTVSYNDAPTLAAPSIVVAVDHSELVTRASLIASFGSVSTGFVTVTVTDGPRCAVSGDGDVLVTAGAVGSDSCTIQVCEACAADGSGAACATTTLALEVVGCLADGDCHNTVCADQECQSCGDTSTGTGIDHGCSVAFPVCGDGDAGAACLSVCGDGVVASDESCDDGNLQPGDGCSATCTVDAEWSCEGTPSTCNHGPVIADYTVTVPSGAPVAVDPLEHFFDPNGGVADASSIRIVTQPDNGTATVGEDGIITVDPDERGGAQSFDVAYEICDTDSLPLCTTVVVTIVSGPSGEDDTVHVGEGAASTITLESLLANDGNVDDTLFVATIDDGPTTHGTITFDPESGVVTYTPDAGYAGSDSFSYTLCSTADDEVCVTQTVTVVVNGDPVIAAASTCVAVGTPSVTLAVADVFSDPDGGALASVTPGTDLTLESGFVLRFTPADAAVAARTTLGYSACDDNSPAGCADGAWEVVYNDPPTVADQALMLFEGEVRTVAGETLVTSFGVVETGFSTTTVGAAAEGPFGTTATLGDGASCALGEGGVVVTSGTLGATTCFVRACEACAADGAEPACAVALLSVTVVECTSGAQCDSGLCDSATHTCLECAGDDDCDDGEVCELGACVDAPVSCGDGHIDGDEACDDGNTIAGDGCTACAIDFGFGCVGEPSVCTSTCGDGQLASDEGCDDGDLDGGDGCSASCGIEDGWSCTGSPSVCTPGCGDGLIVGAEACDDNNDASGDGCSAACAIEDGWTCAGEPSICDPIVVDDFIAQGGGGCSGGPEAGTLALVLLALALARRRVA